MTRWLIVLIATVGLGAGACATEDGYEQSPPAPRSTGVQVPADQLLAAYAANATAADREYQGRVLIITGHRRRVRHGQRRGAVRAPRRARPGSPVHVPRDGRQPIRRDPQR